MRAAIYTRVSTEEQARGGHSLGAQERICREWCARNGHEVVAVYSDAGVSAKNMNRPAVQRLLADAERKPRTFDKIVFHSVDRWSRDMVDTFTTFKELRSQRGISIASATEEAINTEGMTGEVVLAVLSSLAQWQRQKLMAETAKGKRERALKGLYNGTLPFGYEAAPRIEGQPAKPPHLHPKNAKAVGLAFRLCIEGRSAMRIAHALNERGYRTTGNWGANLFGAGTVGPMLRSRFYVGEVSYKGEWVKGQHAPLIDRETFDAAQREINRRRLSPNTATQKARAYPLRSLLVCADCRSTFRGYCDKHRARYYRDTAALKGVSCPHRHRYKAELLEGAVADMMAHIELPADWRARAEELLGGTDDSADVERRRMALAQQWRRAQELYIAGDIDKTEYDARKRRIETAQAELQPKPRPDLRKAASVLRDFGRLWKAASMEDRERLLHMVLGRVYVRSGSIVALEPLPDFYPLLAVASGATYASDGPRTHKRHPLTIVPPGAKYR